MALTPAFNSNASTPSLGPPFFISISGSQLGIRGPKGAREGILEVNEALPKTPTRFFFFLDKPRRQRINEAILHVL